MLRSLRVLVPVLLVSLGVCSVVGAQSESAVTISVDATAAGPPLERVWAYYGYDEANYTTTKDGKELLRTLSAVNSAPPYIRTHFLFNTGDGSPALKWGSTNVYTEDADGTSIYDYTLIDGVMDATVEAGTLPLFQFGFMPEALSTRPDPYENSTSYALDGGCFYPPSDYDKWGALVSSWAEHVKDRYPSAAAWQWELWNEPDTDYFQGTFEEYARLYDYTEAALHAVFPDASMGGPAVASAENGFLAQFLEHCAAGTNAVTGQTGTRLDMVSFHAKGGSTISGGHVQLNLGNQLRLHRLGFRAVAASSTFARTPIVISEADPDGCAACPLSETFSYRHLPAYGAYEVAMMKRSLELAAEAGVDLRGVLTWAFTFPGAPYFAGYRALATNGIHLPVLNAFKLLGSLNGDRLPVTSSGALPLGDIVSNGVRAEPDVDALASIDGDRIQILAWNYHDDIEEVAPAPVVLNVSVPVDFGARARLTHTRVDDAHGNAFAVWVAQGRPETPSAAQLSELRAAMEPGVLESEREVDATGGTVTLSFELPRFGISLVTLEPVAESPRETSLAAFGGCSCRIGASARTPLVALVPFVLAVRVARRRRSRRVHT
jgi:xylan 1,4-beta-xylosidase